MHYYAFMNSVAYCCHKILGPLPLKGVTLYLNCPLLHVMKRINIKGGCGGDSYSVFSVKILYRCRDNLPV